MVSATKCAGSSNSKLLSIIMTWWDNIKQGTFFLLVIIFKFAVWMRPTLVQWIRSSDCLYQSSSSVWAGQYSHPQQHDYFFFLREGKKLVVSSRPDVDVECDGRLWLELLLSFAVVLCVLLLLLLSNAFMRLHSPMLLRSSPSSCCWDDWLAGLCSPSPSLPNSL